MTLKPAAACLLVIAMMTAGGCAVIQTGDALSGESLLRAARPSADAVMLDIYWAELPTAEGPGAAPQALAEFWSVIEETRLPTDLRRRLADNGLRVGVVGGAIPDSLLAMLNPDAASAGPDAGAEGVAPLAETGVRRRTVQLRPGGRVDLQAGPALPSAPVLVSRGGELSGRTFDQAQPTYTLDLREPEGVHARLRITPELRHGEQRLRFTPTEAGGVSRASMSRDAEAFPELAIPVTLAAGEAVVVTSTPEASGRLGGYFHRGGDGGASRRAMIIRLAQAPRDDAFDPPVEPSP